MSSPEWTLPAINLRRWLARIARLKSLLLNSRVSFMRSSQVFLIQSLFSSHCPSGADVADRPIRSLGPGDDDKPALNGSNGDEAVLVRGMVLIVDFQVIDT